MLTLVSNEKIFWTTGSARKIKPFSIQKILVTKLQQYSYSPSASCKVSYFLSQNTQLNPSQSLNSICNSKISPEAR